MGMYRTKPDESTRMPGGIPYIIGNEFAERFSFYGMKGILVIYMTKHLLDSAGQPDYMLEEDAKATYHLFTAAAYFFPLLGSLIADVLLGKYLTIMILSLAYCVGHACLAMGDSGAGAGIMEPRMWLYAGLIFVAIGAGGIKPCVSAHVGDQFGKKNEHLLTKIFHWFYFSINVGSVSSMMLIPVLLDDVGPWLAFGLPGILMALATFMFWMGRNEFVHIPPGGWDKFKDETLSPQGTRALINLTPLFLIFIPMFWACFDQTGSAWVLQSDQMDRHFLGFRWLPSQIQAVNPFLILVLIPVFTYFLYPFLGKFFKTTPLRRIGIGLFVTVVAFGISSVIESNITGGRVVDFSSVTAARGWEKQGLLDDDNTEFGWATAVGDEFPQSVTIELREREVWSIASIEINPFTVAGPPEPSDKEALEAHRELSDEEREAVEKRPDRDNWAKDFTVFVRNDETEGETGPTVWTEVGSYTLEQEAEDQAFDFDSIDATHVRVQIDSNWGGDQGKIGRIRVMSDSPAPESAPDPWPDVAALGYKPHISWQFLAYLLLTAAEVMVSITSLEFAYTQAPKKMKSFIMGIYFLGVSLGNLFVAGVNKFIVQPAVIDEEGAVVREASVILEGSDYYWFFTGMMFVVSLIFIPFAMFYRGRTFIQGEEEEEIIGAQSEVEGTRDL